MGGWLERFQRDDMPVFGKTVQEIMNVAGKKDSSLSELARVILEDPNMTARVLKLANAVQYNPLGNTISTISRAIILLGFEEVRSLSLTAALVDSLVKGVNRERLIQELARSLHAATQAKHLSKELAGKPAEQIFIAALLFHLGELAFWCAAKEEGPKLDEAMRRGLGKEEAELAVLGFPLRQLTARLVQDWRLGGLIEETLAPGKKQSEGARLILLSHELATATEQGWRTAEVAELQKKLAALTGLPVDQVAKATENNARMAVKICRHFGAGPSSIKLPAVAAATAEDDAVAVEVPEEIVRYNPALQLDILRDMSALLLERPDFNLLLEMSLEGIHRGIGMDRALFALVGSGHREIQAKYVVGGGREHFLASFRFPLNRDQPNVFQQVLGDRRGVWVGQPGAPAVEVERPIVKVLGGAAFFVMPVTVGGKSFGLFYADRLPSGRPLDRQSFENFEFFALQASLGLDYIARLRK